MATADRQQTVRDEDVDAERARDELRDVLRVAGVKLPSLSLDAVSCAGTAPGVLVDLGRCNVETARALAVALRRGVGR
ncbi:hypothetical protein [Streptomyces sp. ML-6]|uniref:hypothetical protein n=1 Tax=Streptomyces sp. ML-6 TaxID=2982693 RepID=UPI0024BF243C|nr:hypothetical protein [Streptomyces sp. ML-6]MDK0519998.1 hypothetical protein [Streptomyces sp. ML-6]